MSASASPAPPPATSEEAKTLAQRLLTLPGLIASTVLTTVVAFAVTHVATRVGAEMGYSDPLAISVQTDQERIAGMSGRPQFGVLPRDVRTHGSPGGCDGFHNWLRANHGIDAGESAVQIIAQGRTDKAVVITGMRVTIFQRRPPINGTAVGCRYQGIADIRSVSVDLDQPDPTLKYDAPGKRFAFTVAKGETETFNVTATAGRADYRWGLVLDVVVDGHRRGIEVPGHGRYLETSAELPSRYWWEWNHNSGWDLTKGYEDVENPPAGIPATAPASKPLPVLP